MKTIENKDFFDKVLPPVDNPIDVFVNSVDHDSELRKLAEEDPISKLSQ